MGALKLRLDGRGSSSDDHDSNPWRSTPAEAISGDSYSSTLLPLPLLGPDDGKASPHRYRSAKRYR